MADPKNLKLYVVTVKREVIVAADNDQTAHDYAWGPCDRDVSGEIAYVRIEPLTLKNKPENWDGACLPYGELAHSEFPLANYAAWRKLMAKRKEEDDGSSHATH